METKYGPTITHSVKAIVQLHHVHVQTCITNVTQGDAFLWSLFATPYYFVRMNWLAGYVQAAHSRIGQIILKIIMADAIRVRLNDIR